MNYGVHTVTLCGSCLQGTKFTLSTHRQHGERSTTYVVLQSQSHHPKASSAVQEIDKIPGECKEDLLSSLNYSVETPQSNAPTDTAGINPYSDSQWTMLSTMGCNDNTIGRLVRQSENSGIGFKQTASDFVCCMLKNRRANPARVYVVGKKRPRYSPIS